MRPLFLLDIDGVLNPWAGESWLPVLATAGWEVPAPRTCSRAS
jgi:hypothetical protein